jgi:hypothetical protein
MVLTFEVNTSIFSTSISLPTQETFPMSTHYIINSAPSNSPVNSLFFTFPVLIQSESSSNEPLTYTIYINHSESIPDGQIVWDYFGSGETYCNLNKVELIQAKDNFSQLYSKYMIVNNRLGIQPQVVGLSPFNFASSVEAPSGNLAWSFSIETFFIFNKKVTDDAVCIYLTKKNSDTTVISKHYVFANVPNNICSCSNPSISNSQTKSVPCHFSMQNSSCPLYKYESEIVYSQDVTPINSSQISSFDLVYYLSIQGNHTFKINNSSSDVIINTLKYPSSFTYDDSLVEAISIFKEYMESYSSSDFSFSEVKRDTLQDTGKDIEKSSYISSLISS